MDVKNESPGKMGVLGIALVVEEVGKGARLVFRYPASPPPYFVSCSNKQSSDGKTNIGHAATPGMLLTRESHTGSKGKTQQKDDQIYIANGSIDLFFDLPARVIAKLFRPKRPLCGQPLTLNVSGTTFCCRAELFDNLHSCPATVGGDGNEHPLVLFSVIVALAPLSSNHLATTIISTDKNEHVDSAFTKIASIHANLARLCKVLTREERRCQYVTLQCQSILAVRKEYEDSLSLSSGGAGDGNQSKAVKNDELTANSTRRVSSAAGSNAGGNQTILGDKRNVMQTPSSSTNAGEAKYSSNSNSEGERNMSTDERREYIQQLIELIFASSPPDSNHGNLARELAEVFHFLSKYDDPSSPPTASEILSKSSGRDIYINRHVAVPFESDHLPLQMEHNLSASKLNKTAGDVYSHQTLLFPTLSSTEILRAISDESFTSSFSIGSTSVICRVLTQLQPRKTLKEVASDSALSIHQVLEAAKWLIGSGMCVAALPVTRKSRYVCADGVVDKMRQLSLPFWQTFSSKSKHCRFHLDDRGKKTVVTGVPHIFLVVSALTSFQHNQTTAAPTLGDAIDSLSGMTEQKTDKTLLSLNTMGSSTQREELTSGDAIIYSMAVWLVGNGVISPVETAHDYIK